MFLQFRFNEYFKYYYYHLNRKRISTLLLLCIIVFILITTLLFINNVNYYHYYYYYHRAQQSMLSLNEFNDNIELIREQLQYAIMIDAGSSGSRVYIYVWPPHSGDMRQLLKIRLLKDKLGMDVYHSITPGLSQCCLQNISLSIDYLKPLLDFAAKHIPQSKHKETPLYIMATAGMRLLNNDIQNAILNNLRQEIPKRYSFLFTNNNIAVITGKEEGLYSWIALNYMNGRFDHSHDNGSMVIIENNDKKWTRMSTVQMIEMGGASIQIAFEITNNDQYNNLMKKYPNTKQFKDKTIEINLGCHEHDINHRYRLFITTFLTLGANSMRNQYVNQLIREQTSNVNNNNPNNNNSSNLLVKEMILYDPCLSIDSSETINVTKSNTNNNNNDSSHPYSSTSSSSSTQYLYHLRGSGDHDQCIEKLRSIIDYKGSEWCNESDELNRNNSICPFDELKSISIPFDDNKNGDNGINFYGLSEFWYTMNDIYHLGNKYDSNEFKRISEKYCSTSWLVTRDRFQRKLYPNADYKRLLSQCFKSSWMYTLLHYGFHMPLDYRKFQSISKMNDEPVQWTLGALIYRTRFFPLRTLDQQHGVMSEHVVVINSNESALNFHMQYLLFILCMFAVILFICIYLHRLQSMLNSNNIINNTNNNGKLSSLFHKSNNCNLNNNNNDETLPLYYNDNFNDDNDQYYRKQPLQQKQKEIFINFD